MLALFPMRNDTLEYIGYLGVKNQLLISHCIDLGMMQEIKHLQQIDAQLISLFMKYKNSDTTHYIWRTQGDDKVRSSHAANNGKVFAWDNPPETGHPGEDYGCRCIAEPYTPEVEESVSQTMTSIVDEGLSRWAWYDFVLHYYFGDGKAVRLSHVGHLQDVIGASREHVFKGVER